METKVISDKMLVAKDFVSDQEIRWCPGCGDYTILKQVQSLMPELGLPKEDIVFISGIGCSSRFPYYMDTYGMHSIHGRATAIASGLKAARPDLSVWIITGDGDGLSIGGNHLIHLLRRNFNVNILLFNNEIYGLTKGQYSPTSPEGIVTKSTPMGSIDNPFNPLSLVLGAKGSFVSRTVDREPKHLKETLKRANDHIGTSFVEIYQNCPVFNDGAFNKFTERTEKKENAVYLEHGKPLMFGQKMEMGIRLDGLTPQLVKLNEEDFNIDDLWIHDETDRTKADILARFFKDPSEDGAMPRPFGVFYREERSTYEKAANAQLDLAKKQKGEGDLAALLKGRNTWTV